MQLLFCADLGTSALKAALIDSSGVLHGYCRSPYETKESPLVWIGALGTALQALGRQCPGARASAFIVSGNGPTLVPVSPEAESLRPLYWYDPVDTLEGPSFFLPHVSAFRKQDPRGFARTRLFFSPQAWLSWQLGAQMVTVLPHRGYGAFYWDVAQCESLGIDVKLFPPFVPMGQIIGTIRNGAGDETGLFRAGSPGHTLLPPGIPIVAGASDFIMALIGTGSLEPGMVCNRTGSSEGINVCVAKKPPELPKKLRRSPEKAPGDLRILPHAIEGLWNLGAVIKKSGKLLDDFRSAGHEEKSYAPLVTEILTAPSHPGRAALDAIGRSFLEALGELEEAGFPVKELIISGSQSRSPLWNQYKADLSGCVFKVPEIPDAELGGNAVLGALALESPPEFAGAPDGAAIRKKTAALIRIKETYYPASPAGLNSPGP
ncbi:MAG: sugar kinase [Spirochaetaceae bacterium]|jgi:xylulokinase|nr:sugar kinase [Spirochaetaceae bacterium]